MIKIVNFCALNSKGERIKRIAAIDTETQELTAIDYQEDEKINLSDYLSKRIEMNDGSVYSIRNDGKIGRYEKEEGSFVNIKEEGKFVSCFSL